MPKGCVTVKEVAVEMKENYKLLPNAPGASYQESAQDKVEAVNTSVQASSAFLAAACAHANQHEQHAIEVVQRLRLYSENYVEPTPPPEHARCSCQTRRRNPGRLPG